MTLVFSESKINHKNYTEIILPNVASKLEKQASKLIMEKGGQSIWNFKLWSFALNAWGQMFEEVSLNSLRNKVVNT